MAEGRRRAQGPDSIASWITACACFLITFVTYGLMRCYGILFVSVLHVFQSTRGAAAWPFSVAAAATNLTGPLAGVLNRRYGSRSLVRIGIVVAAIGVASCYFAYDIHFITVMFGVVQGVSVGIVMLQVPIVINQSFLRYRTSAQGIAFSGATMATFIFPSFMEFSENEYGLRGTFLLLGGIMLHAVIGGALIRNPTWIKNVVHKPHQQTPSKTYQEDRQSMPNGQHLDEKLLAKYIVAGDFQKDETLLVEDRNKNFDIKSEVSRVDVVKDQTEPLLSSDSESPASKVLILPVAKSKSITDFVVEKKPEMKTGCSRSNLQLARDILTNPMFYLICTCWGSFFFAFVTYMLVILDANIDSGTSEEDAIFLFITFTAGDIVGRLGLGWVTDKGFVKRKTFTQCSSFCMGVIIILLPISWDYSVQLTMSVLIGLCVGSTLMIFVVLYAEYLQQEEVPMAIGLTAFTNGILALLRPFMIGYFRDSLGTYDELFYTIGSICLFGVLLWFLETPIQKRLKARRGSCIQSDTESHVPI